MKSLWERLSFNGESKRILKGIEYECGTIQPNMDHILWIL
jgi:hypothetical protein